MNDKELLTLAAKAAGIEVKPHTNYKLHKELIFTAGGRNWNPLADDADALRLAVKLEMELDFSDDETSATRELRVRAVEYHGDDPFAATRRAIVRAAAEIGRGME